MLFNKLSDDLFTPLASKNRQVYQSVLLALADVFFDEDLIDPFIPKDLIRATIEETVVRIGVRRWELEVEDFSEEEEPQLPRSSAEYASRIYRRLLACGWFEEEQRIYRTFVLLTPAVSFLLRSLLTIANLEKRSYGGAVLNVLSSLEAAIKDPQGRGITLAEAAQTAVDFSAHLTDMMLGLREIKMQLAQSHNPQEIVREFFDRFVEHILVADYKTLKTQNNPFRFRRQIISLLQDLQFDSVRIDQFSQHYQEQFNLNYHDAQALVFQHINRIIRIFESVDQRLNTIDDFRYRLEKRVADTVRYMDKTSPGMAPRLSRIIANLSQREEAEIPIIDSLEQVGFLSINSLRTPVRRRVEAKPSVIKQQTIDPKVLELRELFKAYKARREVNPGKVEGYIERQFSHQQKSVSAADFKIETIEDYVCFSYVRHMASFGKQGNQLRQHFTIEFKDDYVNVADMVHCRNFVLRRGSAS